MLSWNPLLNIFGTDAISTEIGGGWLGVFCPPTCICISWSQNNRNQNFAMQLPKLMSYPALVMVAWRKFVTSPPFLIPIIFSWSGVRAPSQVTGLLSFLRSNKDAIRHGTWSGLSGSLFNSFSKEAEPGIFRSAYLMQCPEFKVFSVRPEPWMVHWVSTLIDVFCHLF